MIFGGQNKLTARGPFLRLLDAFSHALGQNDILTVVGYSFADEHINNYIARWIAAGNDSTIRIFDPFFDQNSNEFAEQLRNLQRQDAGRVSIIRKGAGEALRTEFEWQ